MSWTPTPSVEGHLQKMAQESVAALETHLVSHRNRGELVGLKDLHALQLHREAHRRIGLRKVRS